MDNKFLKIADRETLVSLIENSTSRPVVIFKHSNSCSISAAAYREMEKVEGVSILEVQTAREISRELAVITGIRHESPQVIVLRDRKAVWNASHFEVNALAVTKVVQAHS